MTPAEAYEKIRKLQHPKIFGRVFLHRVPYPAQMVCMLCPHFSKMASCGRQVGKSKVLISDDSVAKAVTLPWQIAFANGCPRPIPVQIVLIASVKEQAFELQREIANCFDRSDWLHSLLSQDTTKTNIVLGDESRIMVRPATNSSRGLGAETWLTQKGRVIKGPIRVIIDEAWYLRRTGFLEEVVKPMLLMGGKGSAVLMYSTPWGQEGDAWDLWNSPSTGDCCQVYRVNAEGYREYDFDSRLCHVCMLKYRTVRFNFSSAENPHIDRRALLAKKRDLIANGRVEVWRQEYLGIPTKTSGLFFNERHHGKMWDDGLPEYQLTEDGEFVKLELTTGGEVERKPVDIMHRFTGGTFYMGYDGNQGIVSRRADFAAICIVEVEPGRNPRALLRLCQRFKRPPRYFMGERYEDADLTPFMQHYAAFLFELFGVKRAYPDQGCGQAVGEHLARRFGRSRVEYVKTSRQAVVGSLTHLRSMVECNRAVSPPIGFLVGETKYLKVEQDALLEDQVRIQKAHSWGTMGAEVDGLYAWADAMCGTAGMETKVSISVGSQTDLGKTFGHVKGISEMGLREYELPRGMRN